MFVDDGKEKSELKKRDNNASPFQPGPVIEDETHSRLRIAIYSGAGAVIIVLLAVVFYLIQRPALTPESSAPQHQSSPVSTSSGYLPFEQGSSKGNGKNGDFGIDSAQTELITFGNFFLPPIKDTGAVESYSLPINAKADIMNFYDVSRKMDIDSLTEDLNNNGFSITSNQFSKDADTFYDLYRLLEAKDIPIMVTNDFIYYYFQNELKQVFKEVERSAFYDTVWHIYKSLYDISLTRYKKRLADLGLANDPVLEGERMETAWLAMVLKLLMPKESQINTDKSFIDINKFSELDVYSYNFDVPEELKQSLEQEYELIKGAKGLSKSPILMYPQDYSVFKVPDNYRANSKLNNFFLAIQWLNSEFPLYYRIDTCPNCFLDYEDWLISSVAAAYLTKDLNDNQELKNQWAIVYKFISFFNGLRSDLTYLNYTSAYEDTFGIDYDIAEIYSNQNDQRAKDLKKLQNEIASIRFSPLEGAMDRTDENKPLIGMRLLQDSYWPNDYLLGRLVGQDMAPLSDDLPRDVITMCVDKKTGNYRCRGTGLDIFNIISPIESNEYFRINSNYALYGTKSAALREELNDFNINAWNNNMYWLTLDVAKSLLNYSADTMPIFARNELWQSEKDLNTILGSWVNLHTTEDELKVYEQDDKDYSLGAFKECNSLNYIESNIYFLHVLIAKTDMLLEILSALGVADKTNAASIELKELKNKLSELSQLEEKVKNQDELSSDDCKLITDFATHYTTLNKGTSGFRINLETGAGMSELISGVKLLIVVYEKDGKKVIAVGPIFNYKEGK
ncbi:DUF3160 domain-containing protein [Candidatus Parcubacteria bacterium]|nr:DUF3160 domain-containing protein [Candidatus Parcubacteria bacterium]